MKPLMLYRLILTMLVVGALSSCGSKAGGSSAEGLLSECDVIATRDVVHGDTVINCHIGRVDRNKVLDIPLSMLIDSLEIIRLDTCNEALVGGFGFCDFSEHYIVVSQYGKPSLLFTRAGKFVSQLGAIGKGPGEYIFNPWGAQIDEKHGKIFMFPTNASNFIEYDIQGNYARGIPAAYNTTAGHILVDYDAKQILVIQILMSTRTFNSGPPVWLQDFDGNAVWATYEPIKKMIGGGFSNEPLLHDRSNDGVELSFNRYTEIPDSVFYFDIHNRYLIPRFTATFEGETPRHLYYKAADYYLVGPSWYDDGKPNPWEENPEVLVIVDTRSLRGSYCKIYNDFLGGIELDIQVNLKHSRGCFNMIIDPGDLLYRIDERLSKDNISDADRVELNNLRESISEDDNSYILHGEYK